MSSTKSTNEMDVTAWADLYSLLSECFKQPSDRFAEQVIEGLLDEEVKRHATELSLDLPVTEPPAVDGAVALQRQHRNLFTAYESPYVPPAESPYKEWYGNRDGGLMGGPSATDMEMRYERLDSTPPANYPADHVALLLEYASLLARRGQETELDRFLQQHFDWLPALRRCVDDADVEAPFYTWAVATTDAVVTTHRRRRGIPAPAEDAIAAMVERATNARNRGVSQSQ